MKLPRFNAILGKKAQAMVEFALAFPIVLLLVMGIIEGGRLLFIYTSLAAAGREAARYGAGIGQINTAADAPALYNDCDGIRSAAKRIGAFAGINDGDIKISYDHGAYPAPTPSSVPIPYCPTVIPPAATPVPITVKMGDRIVVDVSAVYNPVVPLIPFPKNFVLKSQSVHTLVKEAPVIANTPQVVNISQTCDNRYYKIVVTTPTGPVVGVTLTVDTTPPTATPPPYPAPVPTPTPLKVTGLLVVWDPQSNAVLQGIPSANDWTSPTIVSKAAPAYSYTVNWAFDTAINFNLVFSKDTVHNVVVRVTLNNGCTFGQ